MSGAHTKGPWQRLDTEDYAEIHQAPTSGKLVATSRRPIALVGNPDDADLIAAAPDMAKYIRKCADAGDAEALSIWEKARGC